TCARRCHGAERAEPRPRQTRDDVSAEAGVPQTYWRRTNRTGFIIREIVSLRNLLLPAAAQLFGTRGQNGTAWVLVALAAMIALSVFFAWLAWRNFRYRLGESDVRVKRGLLSRTARSVPYERIQDVSLEQSLVPRLFGMVEVKF